MATVEVLPAGMKAAPVESPSAQIVKAANKTVTVTDELGRSVGVKRITPLERMRLFACAGPELSKNDQWIGLAALAFSVSSIDGEQVIKPNTRREIEFMVDRLGDEGLTAVGKAYIELFGVNVTDELVEDAKN